jgi:tetratricopeptide (TPR) repeat protein
MQHHLSEKEMSDLWTDYLNIGDVYTELKKFDSAQMYADKALVLSRELKSRYKEASSYSILSKLFQRRGDFKKAFDYQQQWYKLDTALVNTETNQSVAELQEKFDVKERESVNRLLQSQVEKQRIQNRSLVYLSIASLVIGLLITGFLLQKRLSHKRLEQVNNVISRQNDKLAELNYEKKLSYQCCFA